MAARRFGRLMPSIMHLCSRNTLSLLSHTSATCSLRGVSEVSSSTDKLCSPTIIYSHACRQQHHGCLRASLSLSRSAKVAADASSRVVAVSSSAEFSSVLKESEDSRQLAVVDFTAQWCRPCKEIAPLFEQLSREHEDVSFIKVDIDKEELQSVVHEASITAVPTFRFLKEGKLVAELHGADAQKLCDMVTQLRRR
eukprot:TRINITY_DN6224_c0_g1_i1.p1 TRINITY_DN6224_c0_g1~~TRINITY_DN6224_c0_g1_i1.p1  ORF type:complete len:207 (-),score=26.38 TRINITY_DN6224_c0_g1_i1:208-795(-)